MQYLLTEQEYSDLKNASTNAESAAEAKFKADFEKRFDEHSKGLQETIVDILKYQPRGVFGDSFYSSDPTPVRIRKAFSTFWDGVFPEHKKSSPAA